jgi:hypothetical protein
VDRSGAAIASGVYFFRLATEEGQQTQKAVLMKSLPRIRRERDARRGSTCEEDDDAGDRQHGAGNGSHRHHLAMKASAEEQRRERKAGEDGCGDACFRSLQRDE